MANEQNLEIEVRFLVPFMDPQNVPGKTLMVEEIEQGYWELPNPNGSFRIRTIDHHRSILTLKKGSGKTRKEFEQDIPAVMAKELIETCHHRIRKTRHTTQDGWVFDFFHDKLNGLILAEHEMASDDEEVHLPKNSEGWIEVTNSLSNLHLARLHSELSDRGEILVDIFKHLKQIPVIALSGGPCSGKSTLITELRARPELTVLPEMASVVISQLGINPAVLSSQDFQKIIYRAQQIFEKSSAQMAMMKGCQALVVDRGTIDNAAYLPGGLPELEQLLKTTRNNEYERYGLVLFMDMPPREVYDQLKANNPARSESYDEALPLSERTKGVWQNHPNFVVITGNDWEEKSAVAHNIIDNFLNPAA